MKSATERQRSPPRATSGREDPRERKARRRRAARTLKQEDQVCGQRLAKNGIGAFQ